MKILHLIDHMGLGGAQIVLTHIIQNKKNHKAFILDSRKNQSNIKTPRFISSKSQSKLSLYPLLELKKNIQADGFEVLHCHLWRSQIYGWVLKKIFFPKIKLIFHIHSRIASNFFGGAFLSFVKKDVNQFIVVSPTTGRELKRRVGGFVNITVIPNFVSPEFYRNYPKMNRFEKDKKTSKISLGFVGRLHKEKGVDDLIKSLSLLENSFYLRIVGDGAERKKLEKLVKKLRLSNQVVFLGKKENVIAEYKKMDILIIPSISEPFGLVWAEAFALGIPVIASKVDGIKDFIEDGSTALLFEKSNIKELKGKILSLSKNLSLKNKLIRNSKKFVKNFTIAHYLESLDRIYKKV